MAERDDNRPAEATEAEVWQAQKMEAVGRLAGGIAHDFNNLLTIIQSFSELVLEDLVPGSPSFEYMGEILSAAGRARDLTRQLLAFSRRQTVATQITTFNELTTETQKLLGRVIGEDIELQLRLEPDPWPVKIDPSHFGQVLLNLVVNARDAMPRGGSLVIETGNRTLDDEYAQAHGVQLEPGDYAMLAVRDTGVGIPSDVLPHIFEPFFTTKDRSRGTGLGLATCYGIVKQAGGFIWAYSEMDHGTEFKVYIPRTHEVEPAMPKVQPPSAEELQGDELILFVEDDDQIRDLIVASLRTFGYRVVAAANGVEALEAAWHVPHIDLVLTDVVMPQMGGRELVTRLRKHSPDLPVVYISGYTDDALTLQGPIDRDEVLLDKPFTPTELARTVREVLDRETTRLKSTAT